MHRIGDTLDERYQLIRPLGHRHGAEIWEAEHRLAGRKVMLKIAPSDPVSLSRGREQMIAEARAAAEIAHPCVVEVYDVGITGDGQVYLATERLRGETLADIVARQGAMQAEDACQVMLQVLSALEAAHAVLIGHGELSTDDIVLRRGQDGRLVVKLLDFGRAGADAPSASGALRSPRSEGRPAEVYADLRAAGAILYEMLTGRALQKDAARAEGGGGALEPARSLVPAIPAALARVVDSALAAAPARGIGSAKEMAALLAPFAISDRPPSLAPRDTLMPFLSPEARRTRGMARLERAVLGLAEPRPSARPNLVLIDGSQERTRPAERSGLAPTSATSPFDPADLIEPNIPRPPRTPKHVSPSGGRLQIAARAEPGWHRRKRSSFPLRRWKGTRPSTGPAVEAPIPRARAAKVSLWLAGALVAASLGAGLGLARLLHF